MKTFILFFWGCAFIVLFSCQRKGGKENEQQESQTAVSEENNNRCIWCAMNPKKYPQWSVSSRSPKEEVLLFCSPRCYFMARENKQSDETLSYYFVEYYTQKRIIRDSLIFVLGSSQIGPMGTDFIPILGEKEASEFMKDHSGKNQKMASEIDAKCIEEYAK